MASRHLSRALVLQTLFESDLMGALVLGTARSVLERNAKEFTLGASDRAFADTLLTGVLAKMPEVDAVIEKAAPQWPLAQIAPIDRNVLRIGLYELLFGDRTSVPPKVALNEAIELAKSFGGEQSGKFVNGVLGTVYRDLGEPDKDARQKAVESSEALAGAVVLSELHGVPVLGLVHDVFQRWTLPKTKIEPGEFTDHAALRAIQNELGITADLVRPLGEHTYTAHDPSRGAIVRTVSYFLARASEAPPLTCTVCDGIVEVRWVPVDELEGLPLYADLRGMIHEALRDL